MEPWARIISIVRSKSISNAQQTVNYCIKTAPILQPIKYTFSPICNTLDTSKSDIRLQCFGCWSVQMKGNYPFILSLHSSFPWFYFIHLPMQLFFCLHSTSSIQWFNHESHLCEFRLKSHISFFFSLVMVVIIRTINDHKLTNKPCVAVCNILYCTRNDTATLYFLNLWIVLLLFFFVSCRMCNIQSVMCVVFLSHCWGCWMHLMFELSNDLLLRLAFSRGIFNWIKCSHAVKGKWTVTKWHSS